MTKPFEVYLDSVEKAVDDALDFVWDRRRLAEAFWSEAEQRARSDQPGSGRWAAQDAMRAGREMEEAAAATSVLAGSVLQVAREFIWLAFGGLGDCPVGRNVSKSRHLAEVIWYGRNQAMHWTEGQVRSPVRRCFTDLAHEISPAFGDYETRSLAEEVIVLLDWRDPCAVRADLTDLVEEQLSDSSTQA